MSRFSQYLTNCVACGSNTSKKYAREHAGKCKGCETGVYSGPKCPDCDGPIERWKLAKGYHCSRCTREADPEGYANEVRGMYDYADSY
jgi:hypothetical protein